MPVNSKSPANDYAARSADAKPNIAYPTGQVPKADSENRAAIELGSNQVSRTVTAIDGTNLRADVDAAMVAQGATACNNAGARTAIAAVLTDLLIRTRTAQTVTPTPTIVAER
jgi:hypothetical protein